MKGQKFHLVGQKDGESFDIIVNGWWELQNALAQLQEAAKSTYFDKTNDVKIEILND